MVTSHQPTVTCQPAPLAASVFRISVLAACQWQVSTPHPDFQLSLVGTLYKEHPVGTALLIPVGPGDPCAVERAGTQEAIVARDLMIVDPGTRDGAMMLEG